MFFVLNERELTWIEKVMKLASCGVFVILAFFMSTDFPLDVHYIGCSRDTVWRFVTTRVTAKETKLEGAVGGGCFM